MNPPIPENPTQTDIDRAREELENANFKLGKARSKSIMSTAEAARDAQDLQDNIDRAAAAENRFAQITDRFINRARAKPAANAPMADADRSLLAGDEGDGLRNPDCGQPKPGANGFAEGDAPPPAA